MIFGCVLAPLPWGLAFWRRDAGVVSPELNPHEWWFLFLTKSNGNYSCFRKGFGDASAMVRGTFRDLPLPNLSSASFRGILYFMFLMRNVSATAFTFISLGEWFYVVEFSLQLLQAASTRQCIELSFQNV